MKVSERFLEYVKIDTQSAYDPVSFPSTEKQRDLAKLLKQQLEELGLVDVYISDNCCLYGKLPANYEGCTAPVVGFSSHMDTTPEKSGTDIKPRIVENYNGEDIVLNEEKNIVMKVAEFPELKKYIGNDLIVTDGTTLLGADDKAGIAEIVQMLAYYHEHPEEKHGELQVFFTSDEEIGCEGASSVDKTRFNPDFAYTLDGEGLGSISYECFNAASAYVTVNGFNIHPGSAKNIMRNAILIANEFLAMLPQSEIPAHTEGYEGYYHVIDFAGEVEKTTMRFYIRDFDRAKFEARKVKMQDIAEFLNREYGEGSVEVKIEDTYFNMREEIEKRPEILDVMRKSMEKVGIIPYEIPLRGGTDGSIMTLDGLPTPDMCDGSHNIHGIYEYVSIQAMEQITEAVIQMVREFAK